MNPLAVLLMEDNPGDVVLFREALAAAGLVAQVHVVAGGDDAIRFLRRQERFCGALRPHVIVLDLNVPTRSGYEVLLEMASDPALNTIPVAVLTSSTSEACVCGMYPEGRCLYFTKTGDFGLLQEIVRQIAAHAKTWRGDA
jgi:two-component system, chemotaxis family, response regulator Rcp1